MTGSEPTCPACGGPGRDRNYRIESFDLYRCRMCRTEFLVQSPDRPPVDVTYWDGYKFDLYADAEVQTEYEQRYERLISPLVSGPPGETTVLDVGCGIGNFVDWAARQGMEVIGVDVDADAVASARDRGLDVHLSADLPDRIEPGSVDILTLWDVIEHVRDPRGFLLGMLDHLRPGGLVVLETPDVEFVVRPAVIAQRKVLEPIRWSDMLYYADHQIYFSGRGLSSLLNRCGLDVVDEMGLRSPSSKMASVFDIFAERGSGAGRIGPALYRALDASMRATGMTNKLIMVGRKPESEVPADQPVSSGPPLASE